MSGIVALVVVGVVATAGFAARTTTALRPSSAEIQLAILSPVSRRRSLARPVASAVKVASGVTAVAMLAVMLVFSEQFSGIRVTTQLAVLAAAGGLGVIAFATHLLVAERRGKPLTLAGAAIAATILVDVYANSAAAPLVRVVRALRGDAALMAVFATYAVGAVLIRIAMRDAERIKLESIRRGSDATDRAAVAVAGNDLRSILLAHRSLGLRGWRERPLLRIPVSIATRWPVAVRGIRGLVRWRASRWVFVAGNVVAISLLLGVRPVSLRTTALAALVLWSLGLALNEPFAQEHDRADRLALLPNARSVELRHIGFSGALTFGLLGAALGIVLYGDASVWTVIGLAGAAASGATVAAVVSLRAAWKPLLDPNMLGWQPEAIGARIAFQIARPGIYAFLCLGFWRVGMTGIAVITPGLVAMTLLIAWVTTDGFRDLRRSALERVLP
ncbi:MAG: hypothetical protein Q8K82_13525 [Gemmatimonadaceae bacterium]|nr:hypothetical protein [Gemmatimonadaceae bacterium]